MTAPRTLLDESGHDPRRWRVLALLALAEFLGMSLWLTASAVSPQLRALWGLSATEGAWLTTIVQLGFVVGTAAAAVLNLADLLPARAYFAIAAALGALLNAGVIVAPGYKSALIFRFLTGVALAGVYPPAMKMIATWFRARRGLAIGTIVGALTVGKATPYLVHALEGGAVRPVILGASFGALVAAALVALFYRDGPFPFPRRPFSWGLVHEVVSRREWRLATGGYLGHMWELYSFWAWIATFLAASATVRTAAGASAPSAKVVEMLAFGAIAIGGLGCIAGGWIADRIGYERLVTRAMATSAACALAIGFVFGHSFWIVVPLSWVWGIAVIADSAQFSALVAESVPAHAVGTALTLQTSLGFLLTMVTIQLIPPVVGLVGWRWAFAMLAIGPTLGIDAIQRLRAVRTSRKQHA
ncbi:MAG: MFS transporter [Gemmatimonadaceae bacterium]